jgi:hypothetical protein
VCIPICEVRRLLARLFGNACNNFMLDLACETIRVEHQHELKKIHEIEKIHENQGCEGILMAKAFRVHLWEMSTKVSPSSPITSRRNTTGAYITRQVSVSCVLPGAWMIAVAHRFVSVEKNSSDGDELRQAWIAVKPSQRLRLRCVVDASGISRCLLHSFLQYACSPFA